MRGGIHLSLVQGYEFGTEARVADGRRFALAPVFPHEHRTAESVHGHRRSYVGPNTLGVRHVRRRVGAVVLSDDTGRVDPILIKSRVVSSVGQKEPAVGATGERRCRIVVGPGVSHCRVLDAILRATAREALM